MVSKLPMLTDGITRLCQPFDVPAGFLNSRAFVFTNTSRDVFRAADQQSMRPIIQPNSPAAEHFPAGWNYCQRGVSDHVWSLEEIMGLLN
jgi:hypothetical protein